ncbi:hypothetical protein SV7mr_14540 [Stieleria bergensis]|uniref:Uncharacterized protein n=1 Tax=Stieleria bergensis TaxID=2528025 RepID=A0A517SS60_9BACT|nr:hypothetical protein SV7mr_14540 [Planctomycetes bacterium SV_7m_r]
MNTASYTTEAVNKICSELHAIMEKYSDLVWYERAIRIPQTAPSESRLAEIETSYPAIELELINDHDQWTAGFNCGMLAASRHLQDILQNHPSSNAGSASEAGTDQVSDPDSSAPNAGFPNFDI